MGGARLGIDNDIALDAPSRVPFKPGSGLAHNATREPNGFAVSPRP